jgi:formate dehydrogenase subunit gamma
MPKASAWNAERAREIITEHIGLEGPMLPILHGTSPVSGHLLCAKRLSGIWTIAARV